jgi:hypothetical protein
MKRIRGLLWIAPVAGILLLAQCESATAPRLPEPDPPEERDSIPSQAFLLFEVRATS